MSLVPLAFGAAAIGVATGATWKLLLARLPEPETTEAKRPYADLAHPLVTCYIAALSATAAAVSLWLAPGGTWPPWLVLSSAGIILAAVDAGTTWIPAAPTRMCWVLMALAGAAMLATGGDWTDVVRMAVGATVTAALFGAVWLATRGSFGFGDVRFLPLVAAPAAAVSIDAAIAALLCGSLLALVHGVWRRLRRSPGLQPWAPAYTLGAYAALLLTTGG